MLLTRRHFLVATGALGLAACAPPPASAAPISDADTLIDWIAAHPDDASVLVDDGRGQVVRHRADQARPIASAVKVVHLVAYAQAVADGRLDPAGTVPVADWERWYVPGADGGAHPMALDTLGATADGTVTWDDLAAVMIDFSDNAATDRLREQLGDPALATAAADSGWASFAGPCIAGEALYALAPDPAADRLTASRALGASWAAGDPAARALGGRYGDPAAPPDDTSWDEIVEIMDGTWAGTVEQLAGAHRVAATGSIAGPGGAAVAATVRRHLERGLSGRLPTGVEGFGQKGGSLAGILSWAGSVRRTDGTVGAAAISFSRLPQQAYSEMSTSGAPLLLGQQALLDAGVATRLAGALAA